MFTQAMSSSMPTATINTMSGRRTSPTMVSAIGAVVTEVQPALSA